jgi:hypothetical protein
MACQPSASLCLKHVEKQLVAVEAVQSVDLEELRRLFAAKAEPVRPKEPIPFANGSANVTGLLPR